MGWQQPDELPTTLSTLIQKAMNDQPIQPGEGILHHAEGVDLIPANIELAGLEVALVNSMNREKMLKQVLDGAKREYDYILLDCMPSLGMLTINALAAADTTLIPVQAQYLSAKGLEQLLQTVGKVRRQINPKLKIEGILLTMTDSRTNYGKQIDTLIRQAYGSKIKVFDQTISRSVRAAETSATGKSIFQHDPKGKVAEAYQSLAREVLADAASCRPGLQKKSAKMWQLPLTDPINYHCPKSSICLISSILSVSEEYRFDSDTLSAISLNISSSPTRHTHFLALVTAVYRIFLFISILGPCDIGIITAGYSLPCDL